MVVAVVHIDVFGDHERVLATHMPHRLAAQLDFLFVIVEHRRFASFFCRILGIGCHFGITLPVVFDSCYHFRSIRLRIITAVRFISNRNASKTIIAADVLSANARSGLSAQR